MKFLIIHGSFGNPYVNWFPRLRDRLLLLNQEVLVPEFPTDDWDQVTKKGPNQPTKKQNLNNWLKSFENQVVPWANNDPVVIIAHSLGPLFSLHALNHYQLNIDTAIFVAPFLNLPAKEDTWQINLANQTFYDHSFDYKRLKKIIPLSYVLYSTNDPYVPEQKAKEFATKVGSSIIPIMGAKHLSSEFNQNEFPLVLELCKSRLNLTLYQKYLAHLSEYHPFDLVKEGKDRAIFLPSSELAKEGTFHFQNLSKGGFCTFPVKQIDYWSQKQTSYILEGRLAAHRVPITRVYIFDHENDASHPTAKRYLRDDYESGVIVYTCNKNDLDIPEDLLDFGIWDDSYVCIVNHHQKDINFSLDSTAKSLTQANKYKKMILDKAKKYTPPNK